MLLWLRNKERNWKLEEQWECNGNECWRWWGTMVMAVNNGRRVRDTQRGHPPPDPDSRRRAEWCRPDAPPGPVGLQCHYPACRWPPIPPPRGPTISALSQSTATPNNIPAISDTPWPRLKMRDLFHQKYISTPIPPQTSEHIAANRLTLIGNGEQEGFVGFF